MSDLDQQLRDLLSEKAATVGPPPPLPDGLREVSATRWWRRRPQWLLVPATALITGAVVIPVALISQNAGVTAMPAQEAQAWAQEVCTNRPEEQAPSQDQVRGMAIAASAVCWWENPANLGDETVGLQSVTALSPSQITDLTGFLADAVREQPTCAMIDSPPQVEHYVFLQDSGGHDWRIDIPEPPCLGFELTGGQYQSAALADWLNSVTNVKDLTGAEVGEALGLTPVTDSPVLGCMRFTEYEDGAGYCLDGVTEDRLEQELLAMQIRGIIRDDAAIAYAKAMLKYRDAMDADAPNLDLIALSEKAKELSKNLTYQSAPP